MPGFTNFNPQQFVAFLDGVTDHRTFAPAWPVVSDKKKEFNTMQLEIARHEYAYIALKAIEIEDEAQKGTVRNIVRYFGSSTQRLDRKTSISLVRQCAPSALVAADESKQDTNVLPHINLLQACNHKSEVLQLMDEYAGKLDELKALLEVKRNEFIKFILENKNTESVDAVQQVSKMKADFGQSLKEASDTEE